MLKAGVWRVRGGCHEREVVEEMTSTKVGGGLRKDLGALHSLSIPKRGTILREESISLVSTTMQDNAQFES